LKYVIGTGHYLSRVVAPKRNVFLGKHFANPTINLKSPKKIYPTSKINTHPWPKTLPKVYHSVVTHVLYHFCDTSLITACVIFSSLKFRVGCTCTFFGDTICLMTNRKMMKIETLIDLHIVLTYWLSTLIFSLIRYLSESCFGNDNKFLLPNPWVVLLFITQRFIHSKFCLPNPFLFGVTPHPHK
jgi:hypothetical protein